VERHQEIVVLLLFFFLSTVPLSLCASSLPADPLPQPVADNMYFEYPTQTWIVESTGYLDQFIEWEFEPIGGRTYDNLKKNPFLEWVALWKQKPYITFLDGEKNIVIVENPFLSYQTQKNLDFIDVEMAKNSFSLKNLAGFEKASPLQVKQSLLSSSVYPVKVYEKTDFVQLPSATINVRDDTHGSISFTVKEWKPGIRLDFGFNSTITYSGATDNIVVTGGTEGVPVTFTDIYNADVAGGWGQVSRQGTIQFFIECRVTLGDSSTPTYFADTTKEVVSSSSTYGFVVYNYANFRLGQVLNLATKSTTRGCTVYSNIEQLIYSDSLGVVNIYSSTLIGNSVLSYCSIELHGANDLYNNLFIGVEPGACPTIDVFNCLSSNVPSYAYDTCAGIFDRVAITGASWPLAFRTLSLTFTGLYMRQWTYAMFRMINSAANQYFINLDNGDVPWVIAWYGTNTGIIYRQYSFNVFLRVYSGEIMSGANVTLFDKNLGKVFSKLTEDNGSIIQQIVTRGFYNQTGGNTLYDYGPFTLNVTKAGYQTYSYTNMTLDEPIDWRISLSPEVEAGVNYWPLFALAFICALVAVALVVLKR